MAKKSECSCGCGCGAGMKGHAIAKIIVGLLVVANAYRPTVDWAVFIGALIVVMGIAKLFHRCE